MPGDRKVSSGRDMVGAVVVTGDDNVAKATISVTWRRDELPSAPQVDIKAELEALKVALANVAGADKELVAVTVAEAQALAKRPEPPKDKIADALGRAVGYAGDAEKLAEQGDKLWPRLKAIGGWLGSYAPALLKLAGIALV